MQKIMFNDNYGLTDAVIKYIKIMTRRIIPDGVVMDYNEDYDLSGVDMEAFIHDHSRYKVGEIVAVAQSYETLANSGCQYLDEMMETSSTFKREYCGVGWRNKMFVKPRFMPHQIHITDIKVERLQDISDEDCLKEGITRCPDKLAHKVMCNGCYPLLVCDNCYQTPREAFAALIDKVSGKGTWEKNPWVFAYEFELIK